MVNFFTTEILHKCASELLLMLTLNILCIFMLRFPSEIWVSLDKKCPYSELFWYEVSLLIQSECGKMRTRVTANKDNFHSVCSSMLDEGMKSVNYIRISHKNSEIFSKSCHGVFGINLNKTFYLITHFMSLVSFYAPWKYQKTRYLFSWGGRYRKRPVIWNGLGKSQICNSNVSFA